MNEKRKRKRKRHVPWPDQSSSPTYWLWVRRERMVKDSARKADGAVLGPPNG
jgi:hypothetical protein